MIGTAKDLMDTSQTQHVDTHIDLALSGMISYTNYSQPCYVEIPVCQLVAESGSGLLNLHNISQWESSAIS